MTGVSNRKDISQGEAPSIGHQLHGWCSELPIHLSHILPKGARRRRFYSLTGTRVPRAGMTPRGDNRSADKAKPFVCGEEECPLKCGGLSN